MDDHLTFYERLLGEDDKRSQSIAKVAEEHPLRQQAHQAAERDCQAFLILWQQVLADDPQRFWEEQHVRETEYARLAEAVAGTAATVPALPTRRWSPARRPPRNRPRSPPGPSKSPARPTPASGTSAITKGPPKSADRCTRSWS